MTAEEADALWEKQTQGKLLGILVISWSELNPVGRPFKF